MLYIIIYSSLDMNQRNKFNEVPYKIKERMVLGNLKLFAQGVVNLKK